MKRILATALAAVLHLGVFATGAGAESLSDFSFTVETPLISRYLEEVAGTQALTPADYTAINALYKTAKEQAFYLMLAEPAYAAYNALHTNPLALKPGKTLAALEADIDSSISALSTNPETIAILTELNQLISDEAALEAAYRNGTLKAVFVDKLLRLEKSGLSIYQRIATDYFIPQAVEATNGLARVFQLAADVWNSDLSAAKKDELMTAIYSINTYAFSYLNNGYWANAKAAADNTYKEAEKLLKKAGFLLTGIFGTNPKWDGAWWHYILFFVLFGWIWMW